MKRWISTKLNERLKGLFFLLSFLSVYKGQRRWNQISATFQGLEAWLGRGSLALIHKAKWVRTFRMFLSARIPLSGRGFFFSFCSLLYTVTQRAKPKLSSLPALPPPFRRFAGSFWDLRNDPSSIGHLVTINRVLPEIRTTLGVSSLHMQRTSTSSKF